MRKNGVKMKFTKYLIMLCLCIIFNDISSQSLYTKGALRGLTKISKVSVTDIKTDLENDGLSTKFLKTTIEVKLTLAGIDISGNYINASKNKSSNPELYLAINSIKNSVLDIYALDIDLMLIENVKQFRNENEIRSTIWNVNTVVLTPANQINGCIQSVKDLCDIFINDYYKENQKTEFK